VGFALTDSTSQRILNEISIERWHPLGLIPPAPKDPGRVCDFFDRNAKTCKSWVTRPSECSSYFCSKELELQKSALKKEQLSAQSKIFFEFEFQLAQQALLASGFSSKKVSQWTEEWNAWVNVSKALSPDPWSLSLKDREEVYKTIWSWVRAHSWEDLFNRVEKPLAIQVESEVEIGEGTLA